MKRYKLSLFFLLYSILALNISCKKYLEEKPDKKLVVPSTIDDLRSLLNNDDVMNWADPSSGDMACDNLFLLTTTWNALYDLTAKYDYIWDDRTNHENEWADIYLRVFNANVILENADNVGGTASEVNDVKGRALFYRGYTFYQIAQHYCVPYNEATAESDLGIPLKLKSDINDKTMRATVKESYFQMISDLKQASLLLPVKVTFPTQPGKAACYGALARCYLAMADYQNAFLYADSCLQINSKLLDLNDLNPDDAAPYALFNKEVILHYKTRGGLSLTQSRGKVDSALYASYSDNDLRKTLNYKSNADGSHSFKGNYDATTGSSMFSGIATDEIFLIRAECSARLNRPAEALTDLNTLLKTRWKTGTYVNYQLHDNATVLRVILKERRMELAFRGTIRWADLRRLNKDSFSQQKIERNLTGQVYSLAPGDPKYTFLIPQNVINVTGIQQNKR